MHTPCAVQHSALQKKGTEAVARGNDFITRFAYSVAQTGADACRFVAARLHPRATVTWEPRGSDDAFYGDASNCVRISSHHLRGQSQRPSSGRARILMPAAAVADKPCSQIAVVVNRCPVVSSLGH